MNTVKTENNITAIGQDKRFNLQAFFTRQAGPLLDTILMTNHGTMMLLDGSQRAKAVS